MPQRTGAAKIKRTGAAKISSSSEVVWTPSDDAEETLPGGFEAIAFSRALPNPDVWNAAEQLRPGRI